MEKEFKIGDKVKFNVTPELQGKGTLLAKAFETAIVTSWMVLIEERYTDFLKNRAELALLVLESHMNVVK